MRKRRIQEESFWAIVTRFGTIQGDRMTVNNEIKSAVKSKSLIMGSRTVIKSLKNDNLSTVV